MRVVDPRDRRCRPEDDAGRVGSVCWAWFYPLSCWRLTLASHLHVRILVSGTSMII